MKRYTLKSDKFIDLVMGDPEPTMNGWDWNNAVLQSRIMLGSDPRTDGYWDLVAAAFPCAKIETSLMLGLGLGTIYKIIRWKYDPECIAGLYASDIQVPEKGDLSHLNADGIYKEDFLETVQRGKWDLVIEDLFIGMKKPIRVFENLNTIMDSVDKLYVSNFTEDSPDYYHKIKECFPVTILTLVAILSFLRVFDLNSFFAERLYFV